MTAAGRVCYAHLLVMSWYHKETQTPFDTNPIDGVFFLHGDILARVVQQEWTKGMKYPMLDFPSGVACELWETGGSASGALLHLFGEMDIPLNSTQEQALERASDIAKQVGYHVIPNGDTQLQLIGHEPDDHFLLIFDNQQGRIVDVVQMKTPASPLPSPDLLDQQSREQLPPLYSNEALGLEALAQIKFFSADSGWTWYASEGSPVDADGYLDTDQEKVDFLFFGLVSGFEIEFGYFSLSELSSVRGEIGLPVERDLDFQPKSLAELQAWHKAQRRQ